MKMQGRPSKKPRCEGFRSSLRHHVDPSFVAVSPAPFLPHEIIENILHRLPVKSLCRFKCVSKSWLNLISDSAFVKLHLDRAKKESSIGCSDHLMLGIIARVDKRSSFRSMPVNNLRSIPCTHDKISLPGVLCWNVVGSCDGLVCLINYNNAIILCNPSTGAQLILEPPSVYFQLVSSYGFGCDRTCHDYKVIRVVEDCTAWDTIRSVAVVQMYSLKDKTWRTKVLELPDGPPIGRRYPRVCTVIVGDAMYWWGRCCFWRKLLKEKLLRYQLEEDKWSSILLPSDYYRDGDGNQTMIGLERVGDRLCLLVRTIGSVLCEAADKIDFWISEKDVASSLGDEAVWNKLFVMSIGTFIRGHYFFRYEPVMFSKDEERFLFRDDGMFHWFDMRRKVAYIGNHWDYIGGNLIDHVTYVGSLVPL
ncbi:hypothetical protein Droror1_Dr00022296 [Drosera rotundifolia]